MSFNSPPSIKDSGHFADNLSNIPVQYLSRTLVYLTSSHHRNLVLPQKQEKEGVGGMHTG